MTLGDEPGTPTHAVFWEDEDGKWSLFDLYDNEEEAEAKASFWQFHATPGRIVRHVVMRRGRWEESSQTLLQRALAHRIMRRTHTGETPGPGQRTEAEADAYVLAQLVARKTTQC